MAAGEDPHELVARWVASGAAELPPDVDAAADADAGYVYFISHATQWCVPHACKPIHCTLLAARRSGAAQHVAVVKASRARRVPAAARNG